MTHRAPSRIEAARRGRPSARVSACEDHRGPWLAEGRDLLYRLLSFFSRQLAGERFLHGRRPAVAARESAGPCGLPEHEHGLLGEERLPALDARREFVPGPWPSGEPPSTAQEWRQSINSSESLSILHLASLASCSRARLAHSTSMSHKHLEVVKDEADGGYEEPALAPLKRIWRCSTIRNSGELPPMALVPRCGAG
jgi:hypothetical protein